MSKKKQPVMFASTETEIFIKLKYACIHPLCIFSDGVPVVTFGKDKTMYLRVTDAINWHEKELQESRGGSGNPKALEKLREVLGNFQAGKVKFSSER